MNGYALIKCVWITVTFYCDVSTLNRGRQEPWHEARDFRFMGRRTYRRIEQEAEVCPQSHIFRPFVNLRILGLA